MSHPLEILLHTLLLLLLLPALVMAANAQVCNSSVCGGLELRYPFGIDGSGCGNAAYQLSSCDNGTPVFSNSTSLRLRSIDYQNQIISFQQAPVSGCPIATVPAGSSVSYCSSGSGSSRPDVLCLNGTSSCCIQKSNASTDSCSYQYTSASTANAPVVELSSLNLTWDRTAVWQTNCTHCQDSGGGCGYNSTSGNFLCLCKGFNSTGKCDCAGGGPCKTNKNPIILSGALAVVIIVVVLIFGVSLSIYWKWKKNDREGTESQQDPIFPMETETKDNIRMILSSRRGEPAKVFTVAELEKATNGFSKDNKIGSGGFGTVYKGLFDGGTVVMAVKRANHASNHSSRHFLNEVTVLSQVNHRNLVRLVGCCVDTDVPMLVYEYVPNGTLFQHLHKRDGSSEVLNWSTRLRIAIETAEALAYLHSAAMPPIYHRDVKSSNILLEYSFTAKVADFGLSRLVPIDATHVSTMVQGTPGYVDPEYHQTYQLTDKSDVYSFGVVLLELVTGRKPVDFSRATRDVNLSVYSVPLIRKGMLEELADPRLDTGSAEVLASIKSVANIAVACLAFFREDRPTMKQVLEELLAIRGSSRHGNEGLPTTQDEVCLEERVTSYNPSAGISYASVTTSSSGKEDLSTELTPR